MSDKLEHAKAGLEHAHHATGHVTDSYATRIAILIAVMAAVLTLIEMSENSAQSDYLTNHISVSDDWNFFQAKNVRATVRATEANVLESLANASDPAIAKRIAAAHVAEARLRDDPQAGDGMRQLTQKAQRETEARDHAFHRYHQYELIVGALQIAIVLTSIALVTRVHWLAWTGGIIGTIAGCIGLGMTSGLLSL